MVYITSRFSAYRSNEIVITCMSYSVLRDCRPGRKSVASFEIVVRQAAVRVIRCFWLLSAEIISSLGFKVLQLASGH